MAKRSTSKAAARKAGQAKPRASSKGKSVKTSHRVAPAAKSRKGRSLAALTRELNEARQQQAATAEILKVINSSPGDLTPVFDIILQKTHSLCDVPSGSMQLYDGDHLRAVAVRGMSGPFEKYLRQGFRLANHVRQIIDSGHSVQTVDLADVVARMPDDSAARAAFELGGTRTMLSVPLVKDGVAFGRIVAARQEVRPFTEKQIALLQGFADQAVIAIENARLFNETREALERQTATAEVLKIISASPAELEPVFEAMLTNAVRLCEAKFGMLFLYDGNEFRAVGKWNLPPAYNDSLSRNPIHADPMIPLGRVLMTKRPVHVADVLTDQSYIEGYPGMISVADLGGARTLLQVPLLKENELVGTIAIYRQEVRPFNDKQIALVQNFAAQAVIAIENGRLLSELRQRTDDLTQSLEDLRAAQDRLIQTEKLASLGQLTAGIAHEIKNPLNFVNNFSALSAELIAELDETLASAPFDPKMRADVGELTGMLKSNLEKVVQHGKRADSIVKNMLLHSRESSGEHRAADINALVEESLNLAYHGARAEKSGFNITLTHDLDPEAGVVELYPQEVTRALLNLISNGFYAATKRKSETADAAFEPSLSATTKNLGDSVEIRIRDNGTGIPPEVKEKMFNPFFTTKPTGEGTGLGLSMTHDILVKQHRGSISVETEPGVFTEFIIRLPRNVTAPPQTRAS
jgi:signal transduction histidine kinase